MSNHYDDFFPMIRDGLFDRFPVNSVYGMHNILGIPAGQFAVRPGPMMAAGDYFKIVLSAAGTHAALPHITADPILAGSALVQGLQSLVSRTLDPLEPAVLSVTQFHGGEATNVIPLEEAQLAYAQHQASAATAGRTVRLLQNVLQLLDETEDQAHVMMRN